MALKQAPGCLQAPDGSYYVTLTDGAGNLVTAGGGGGSGTVTSVSVVTANGFSGTVANATTTPAITLSGGGTTTIGTTPISGGATTQVLFNNAGVVGSDAGLTKVSGATGAVTLGGVLNLPDTAAGPIGIINFGGARFIHDTGATSNVFVGHNAGNLTTTGTLNTVIGESAGLALAAGGSNTFVGRFAGGGVTSGTNNVAIGSASLGAGANATAGSTAVGQGALGSATGANNTGIGLTAGADVVAGIQNTFLGQNTGRGITSGSSNTVIGAGVTGLAAGLASAVILAAGGGVIKADIGQTNATSWTFAGPITPKTYIVSALPAAPGTGAIAVITDQLTSSAAKGVAPTGGGSVVCTVMYNGAGWVGI